MNNTTDDVLYNTRHKHQFHTNDTNLLCKNIGMVNIPDEYKYLIRIGDIISIYESKCFVDILPRTLLVTRVDGNMVTYELGEKFKVRGNYPYEIRDPHAFSLDRIGIYQL